MKLLIVFVQLFFTFHAEAFSTLNERENNFHSLMQTSASRHGKSLLSSELNSSILIENNEDDTESRAQPSKLIKTVNENLFFTNLCYNSYLERSFFYTEHQSSSKLPLFIKYAKILL